MKKNVSIKQLQRYPLYLKYLLSLQESGVQTITSPMIANALSLSEEQVKKDLQSITSSKGKPNKGRDIHLLIADLQQFLGYHNTSDAIIIGVGHLGEAFLFYQGFAEFGLNILAGFDIDKNKINKKINGKLIYAMTELENEIQRLQVKIAILTTPADVSQQIAENLEKIGIKAIWNFSPIPLNLNEDIVIENVNLASSLAVLSHKLKQKFLEE